MGAADHGGPGAAGANRRQPAGRLTAEVGYGFTLFDTGLADPVCRDRAGGRREPDVPGGRAPAPERGLGHGPGTDPGRPAPGIGGAAAGEPGPPTPDYLGVLSEDVRLRFANLTYGTSEFYETSEFPPSPVSSFRGQERQRGSPGYRPGCRRYIGKKAP